MAQKYLTLITFTFASLVFGQVGINTATPNSTLSIEGSLEAGYKEVSASYSLVATDHYVSYVGGSTATITLPPVSSGTTAFTGRMYKIKNISAFDLTLKPTGSDKIRNDNTVGIPTFTLPSGYYAELVNNTNTVGTGTWDLSYVGYPKVASINYMMDNIYDYTATAPQDVTVNGTDLTGFTKTINIPANTAAKIVLSYSIPVGTYQTPSGYFGVTLMKNSVELPSGSRKVTVQPFATAAAAVVTSINALIADDIVASPSAQNITYSLKAYLEGTNTPVRYGMENSTPANFNWGRGYWSMTVYYK
ncbi:hypothetical protein [Sphingobacterium athyrii]|uniref:DUF1735 domain-containing protein n=1 Tax=Sphingobacterium athyrii TaxID=2152717 RepID=A0A363NUX5_9SPHI|nr:hypothetical protein [Sphingobacterium athyrii]PUV24518.1 hypothetical protein DCO56_14340 [Sphingobacterium athyrii]